jgi:DNA polymerase-3 subunit gamma/tau
MAGRLSSADVTALYRKYRSAVLTELIGQDHIVRTLSNELRGGHLAHAYLFAGIRGTGKTSTARILARAVNCLEPVDGEPCNHCTACIEILSGSAVDVLEIDAASNRGIDEMRELRERVRYLPAQLRSKVYIIDEAHMLTSEAWNAFLKTLEEPPAHVLFILCTTEPHKVPDTVRSRVQRFDFGRVSSVRIDAHLQSIAVREGAELDPDAARLIARAAQGSVRDGLSLLDQCFATGDSPVTVDTCRRALGLAHPDVVRALLEGLAGRDAAAALRAAAAAFEAGADPRQLLRECSRLARAAELVAVGFAEGAELDADEEELCRRLASREPDGFWLRVLEEMGTAELELRQPVDARLQVEACLLRLCRGVRVGGEAERVDGLEVRLVELERRMGAAAGADSPPGRAAAPRAEPASGAARASVRPAGHGGAETARSGGHVPASTARPVEAGARPVGAEAGRAVPDAASAGDAPATSGAAPASASADGAPVTSGAADGAPVTSGAGPDPDDTGAPPAAAAATAGSQALVSLEAWKRAWPALIEAVNRRDKVFAGVLRGCRPLEATAGTLVVGAPYDFHLKQLRNPAKRPVLAGAVAEVAGGPRELDVEFCGEAAAPVAGAADAGANLTDAVVATFTGSRITSTRLVDHAHDQVGEGPGEPGA